MSKFRNINFKMVGLALLAGLVLAGFWKYTDPNRSSADADQIVIRFWNGFTGHDGRSIIRLAEEFNQQNPDIKVLVQRIDWGTYYNKLFVAGLGGRAPEVFVLHATMVPRFIEAGFLSPQETDPSLANDIDEPVWNAVFRNGQQWAVPLDVLPMGMYCNRQLFLDAGITNKLGEIQLPGNREELLDAMHRLTKDTDGDGKIDQWGYAINWARIRLNWQSVVAQMGGRLVSKDGTTCTVNAPENIEALQFFVDLIEKEQVSPKPENYDAWVGFLQDKVGIMFEGIWALPELRKSGLDFEGGAFPVIGDAPGVWGDSHALCLFKSMPERTRTAAMRFIHYLSDRSLDWAENGPIPVRKSLRASPRFKEMKIQTQFATLIPHLEYSPMVPCKLELDHELDIATEYAVRRTLSPSESLTVAAGKIQKALDRGGGE